MSLITNAKQAREAIGKQVWWDDHGSRWVTLRTGFVTDYHQRNIEIDGSYHWMADLKCLRDTAAGGAFPNGSGS